MASSGGGKAKGGAFALEKTLPYTPTGKLFGQFKASSCLAANCRMLLQDAGVELPESILRHTLGTTGAGARASDVPEVLSQFNAPMRYEYRTDLSIEELSMAITAGGSAIVIVRTKLTAGAHAVIVDNIETNFVSVRDPLPEGIGAAYKVALERFLKAWRNENSGLGSAVIVR